jgi:hypothetical protein
VFIATFGDQVLAAAGPYVGTKSDAFLIKVHSSGTIAWAISGGGRGEDKGLGVTVDQWAGGGGNAYVTGSFHETATFGHVTLSAGLVQKAEGTVFQMNTSDTFVMKVSPQGTVMYVNGGGGVGDDEARGIACTSEYAGEGGRGGGGVFWEMEMANGIWKILKGKSELENVEWEMGNVE